MKAHIIYGKYYDFENQKLTIGGVQTYINNLIPIINEKGFECVVYQAGNTNETVLINGVRIYNVTVKDTTNANKSVKTVLGKVEENFDNSKDFILFATDMFICKNSADRSIAIQHGICWDIPCHKNFTPKLNALYSLRKSTQGYKILNNLCYAKNVVCVDYNFVNWYRAISAYEATPLKVIPNFTQIAPIFNKDSDKIKIIFARRFFGYRGTKLFTSVIGRILDKYSNVEVTIAGTGPDEQYMKDKLKDYDNRVEFTTYKPEDSLEIHKDKHIAVVPTIGSEGTSLSLLEAMSAQCAVVCTNVGGMTNIVIDKYNGRIVSPKEDELFEAIDSLVSNEQLRNEIAKRGYETVKYGFSYEKWAESWKKIISSMVVK